MVNIPALSINSYLVSSRIGVFYLEFEVTEFSYVESFSMLNFVSNTN